ncbi:dihydroorotate dehydrogenase [Mumia quercus]|uniref:dihydroorotate dehydrogenase n=1 Tax=Mumia quercus TaxID=2976125 RepID=UPI0021D22778|nr:dihydroorotate dehydrogenase [Mumia quercus]
MTAVRGAAIAAAEVDLGVDLCGLALPNPVMTASGCAAAGRELDQFFDVAALGAIVTKSIMLNPRSGRPTPRMVETPSGMLNSIGLQGPGIDAFLARDLPWLVQRGARAVVSIAGEKPADYVELARRVGQAPGVAAIEVNISCPNVENRGMVFACDPESSYRVMEEVRPHIPRDIPVFAKLTPDVTDIASIAGAVAEAGADGVTVINTLLGLAMDPDTLKPRLGGVTGGLSGPAVRPVAVRAVWQIRKALPDLPIIGVGGIRTGFDALEFVLAGADAVQVGTVIFHDPSAPMRIVGELRDELAQRGIKTLDEVRGTAHD